MGRRDVGVFGLFSVVFFLLCWVWINNRNTTAKLERLQVELIQFREDISRFKSLTDNRKKVPDQYFPTNLWVMERRLQDIESELETLLAVGTVIDVVDRRDRINIGPPAEGLARTTDDSRLLEEADKWVAKNYTPKNWLPVQNKVIMDRMYENEKQAEGRRFIVKDYEELNEFIPRRFLGTENAIDFPLPNEVVQRRFVRAKPFTPRREHQEEKK
ncbi:MAG: hypothetical protein JNK90_17190 [Planctomycetaceae bacterium]|nr:hypothetical protein [Planctomycetaceae bacterium]